MVVSRMPIKCKFIHNVTIVVNEAGEEVAQIGNGEFKFGKGINADQQNEQTRIKIETACNRGAKEVEI